MTVGGFSLSAYGTLRPVTQVNGAVPCNVAIIAVGRRVDDHRPTALLHRPAADQGGVILAQTRGNLRHSPGEVDWDEA